ARWASPSAFCAAGMAEPLRPGSALPRPRPAAWWAFGTASGRPGVAPGPGGCPGPKGRGGPGAAPGGPSTRRPAAPRSPRAPPAVAAAIIALGAPSSWGQIGAIALGGIVGALLLRGGADVAPAALPLSVSRALGALLLALFFALLIGLPLLAAAIPSQALKD